MSEGARKGSNFIVVCTSPDVCLTPFGPVMVPVPYQIVAYVDKACMVSPDVKFAGEPAMLVDQSMVMKVVGNEAGTGGGIISGHNQWIVEFDEGSSKVHVNGKRVVRHGDSCWMNGRNTRGKVICTDGMGPACSIKDGRPLDDLENGKSSRFADEAASNKENVSVKGKVAETVTQICSLRLQTLSAADQIPSFGVDVILIDPSNNAVKWTFTTGGDGRTERVRNDTAPDDYEALVGDGEWIVTITSDEDPKVLESTDWFDWEAEE